MKYNQKMDFVHHVIRPLWSIPIGLIYAAVCLIIWNVSEKKRDDYNRNKDEFNWPISLEVFAANFKKVFKYRWDGFGTFVKWLKGERNGYELNVWKQEKWNYVYMLYIYDLLIKIFSALRGLLDHDNFELEYFMQWGDCDDCKHVVKALTEKGYNAFRIGMIGKSITSWHFDCIIKPAPWENNQEYALFNYGNLIYGSSIEDCLTKFSKLKYWKDKYKAETLSWWQCKY